MSHFCSFSRFTSTSNILDSWGWPCFQNKTAPPTHSPCCDRLKDHSRSIPQAVYWQVIHRHFKFQDLGLEFVSLGKSSHARLRAKVARWFTVRCSIIFIQFIHGMDYHGLDKQNMSCLSCPSFRKVYFSGPIGGAEQLNIHYIMTQTQSQW